jgi:hypothetical protein
LGVLGSALAGVACIASGVVNAAFTGGRGPEVLGFVYPDEALYVVALVGMLGGIVGLHARQTGGYGRLGKTGFFSAFVGTALLLMGFVLAFVNRILVRIQLEGEAFSELAFPDWVLGLGLLGALVGFALLGVATLRLGMLPRWTGPLLIVCFPLAIALGNDGGGVVLGMAWLALGYALMRQRDISALLRNRRR